MAHHVPPLDPGSRVWVATPSHIARKTKEKSSCHMSKDTVVVR